MIYLFMYLLTVYTWMILSSTLTKCLKIFSNTRYTLQFFTAVDTEVCGWRQSMLQPSCAIVFIPYRWLSTQFGVVTLSRYPTSLTSVLLAWVTESLLWCPLRMGHEKQSHLEREGSHVCGLYPASVWHHFVSHRQMWVLLGCCPAAVQDRLLE